MGREGRENPVENVQEDEIPGGEDEVERSEYEERKKQRVDYHKKVMLELGIDDHKKALIESVLQPKKANPVEKGSDSSDDYTDESESSGESAGDDGSDNELDNELDDELDNELELDKELELHKELENELKGIVFEQGGRNSEDDFECGGEQSGRNPKKDFEHDYARYRRLVKVKGESNSEDDVENPGAPGESEQEMKQKYQHMLLRYLRLLSRRQDLTKQQQHFQRVSAVLSMWMQQAVASSAQTGIEISVLTGQLLTQQNTLEQCKIPIDTDHLSVGRKIQPGSMTFVGQKVEDFRTKFFQEDNPLYINWLGNQQRNPLVAAPGQDEITTTLINFIDALGHQVDEINRDQRPLKSCSDVQMIAGMNEALQNNLMLLETWDLRRHSPDPNIEQNADKYGPIPPLDQLCKHPDKWN